MILEVRIAMRRVCGAIGLLAGAMMIMPSAAARGEVDQAQVQSAMKKGVDFLLAQQRGGHWADYTGYPTVPLPSGVSALALHALLESGEVLNDPRLSPTAPTMKAALDSLASVRPRSTYVAAYQVLAFAGLGKKAGEPYRVALKRALGYLLLDEHGGAFGYSAIPREQPNPAGWYDHSNSQAATLAVFSAVEDGDMEVGTSFWQRVSAHWRRTQDPSGGWCYYNGPLPKGGWQETCGPEWRTVRLPMSAAGVATLFITNAQLGMALDATTSDHALENGLAYLENNFSTTSQLGYDPYYLFALERVGLASGRKFFKNIDWYDAATQLAIAKQDPDGGWTEKNSTRSADTAFTLLFLARGQHPVLFNKLQYAGPWNARPMDDWNLSRRIGRTYEAPVNWQSVSIDVPAERWMDAPILLITGRGAVTFTPNQLQRLREYVNAGGLIFSSADGDDAAFTTSIRTAAEQMVGGVYKMEALPATHPIFSIEEKVTTPPPMLGLSNGARALWVHSPTDLGARWQQHNYADEFAWRIPANLFFYWSGRESPRRKFQLSIDKSGVATTRSITVARITYDGNWDPEPAAWSRESLRLAAVGAGVQTVAVAADQLDVQQAAVAHLTGTAAFTLSPAGVERLKAYIAGGGQLLVDPAGGSPGFVSSALALLQQIAPQEALEVIPASDDIFRHAGNGAALIDTLEFRRFSKLNGARGQTPTMMGIKHNGKWAVMFSPGDLTEGLVGAPCWQIAGMTPESAQAVVRNLLLAASH